MEHVILTAKVYDRLISYLTKTQIYENVAELLSITVSDVHTNSRMFDITSKKAEPVNPGTAEPASMKVNENINKKG
jgi:hypothetical protein